MKKLFQFLVACFVFINITSAQQLITQRQITLLQKAKRPSDLWPRGDGHIVLGEPGSPLLQKAYYEPGGSFSPGVGSFGVSIWVMDNNNKLIATSDNIPMQNIEQHYVFEDKDEIPSVKAITPYYTCEWRMIEQGKWQLNISNADTTKYNLMIVSRSVGPAGGPMTSAWWDSTRLMISHRWNMTPSVKQTNIIIGNEAKGELQKDIPYIQTLEDDDGWVFAKLGFNQSKFSITIVDTKPQYASMLEHDKTLPQFEMDLPDTSFVNSLDAQITNLMVGYIGRQTGPGEPVNYPLAWERDGAYSLQAMAKSGNLKTAKELSYYFAENDFFGGFGAEGDAPGSEINTLTELAFLLNDTAYYNYIWPHIKRKLGYIDEMMHADGNVYKNFIGPLTPQIAHDLPRRQLICKKFEDGIIQGTMDGHFPSLYITAISYRGLMQASRLAKMFHEDSLSNVCIAKADTLKQGWMKNFGKNHKYDNERNFMISIWPSWMTNKNYDLFQQKIKEKHEAEWNDTSLKERPLWTYFTCAEAHQWLYMDRPDMTWKVLHYFWNNQCSPGFYTYWEGNGEENTFRQWDNYRGWLDPKYVTPHYWTASEMALLQMDMLVYINEANDDYEIVIGAGVPKEWLAHNMSVQNFHTKCGDVSWNYKNNVLNVVVKNASKKYSVRAGVNFINANTKVNVSYK
ncbi:MAG: hypothetical protein ABJA35_08630 [Parafilimonas sp.]